MKVLLVYDHDDWILGEIARQLSSRLATDFYITTLGLHSSEFTWKFLRLQSSHDIVHFLVPYRLYTCHAFTTKPCILTVWHMVDWSQFDHTIYRSDLLYVGSAQWKREVQPHIPSDLPISQMVYGLATDRFTRNQRSRSAFLNSKGLPETTVVIGYAASATPNEGNRKRPELLWNCLRKLKSETNVPFRLRMIGRDWHPEIIPDVLKEQVILDAYIPQDQLPDYYSSLDYYLCTSSIEGVPYPVLESMSCECTTLSTPVGVVPEIMDHGVNGFILQEGLVERDFARIVAETAHDIPFRQRCGSQARSTIVHNFDWKNVIKPGAFLFDYETATRHFLNRSLKERRRYSWNAIIAVFTSMAGLLRSKARLRSRMKSYWSG